MRKRLYQTPSENNTLIESAQTAYTKKSKRRFYSESTTNDHPVKASPPGQYFTPFALMGDLASQPSPFFSSENRWFDQDWSDISSRLYSNMNHQLTTSVKLFAWYTHSVNVALEAGLACVYSPCHNHRPGK